VHYCAVDRELASPHFGAVVCVCEGADIMVLGGVRGMFYFRAGGTGGNGKRGGGSPILRPRLRGVRIGSKR
jgi:hypothetical protein